LENDLASLRDEIKKLKTENAKIARELRINTAYLDKVSKAEETQDAFRKMLSESNARQKAYTDMLLESCPNIILLFDDDGKLVLCTKMFLLMTRTPNFDYIKGSDFRKLFSLYMSDEDITEFEVTSGQVHLPGEGVTLSKWIDLGQNGSRYFSIEFTGIGGKEGGDAGITRGVLAVFQDLTDLMGEKQRAEAANRAKSDFLAVMSHEIRTPMNAILGLNEILSRTELTPLQSKYLDDVKRSTQSLLTIINDILDFSKIEAGKLEIVSVPFNLRSLLDNLHTMFGILYNAKNLDLAFSADENLPEWIMGDENRIRQILTNLLSNALKYTNRGEVVFSARLETEAGDAGQPGMLRFDIKDTGIGIKEEDREKLFKPFEQLDLRKNRNVVGTGLGLAISYQLCRLMGGNLWVESEYGKGSTFSVTAPFTCAAALDAEDSGSPPEFTAPDAKILVVDDIDINREVCAVMLESFGIKADLAPGGAEAVECAATNGYDLIFMDHMMPGMDGIEATAYIRSIGGRYAALPIIALTANVVDGAEQMFLANKIDGLLAKPIELARLNACLRRWLPEEKIQEPPELAGELPGSG
jgi:signal transduction histidine kinase